MANTPGGNEPGGRNPGGSDPDGATDSRPISVSELLARTQAADAADATTGSRRDRGRRRAGRAGAVSVSELTGEIPRVEGPAASDTPGTTPDTAGTPAPTTATPSPATPTTATPATPAAGAPAPSAPTPDGPETAPWSPSPTSGAFPRSQNPLAARGPATGPVTEPGPRVSRGASSGAASGMPSFAPPPTRDFTSGDVSRRLRDQPADPASAAADTAAAGSDAGGPDPTSHDPATANAVTGIIPLVDDADAAADADPAADTEDAAPRSGRFEEVFDEDFEAYRSFADVEHAEEEPEKKRRWFGRGKKQDTAAASAAAAGAATAGAAAAGMAAAADTDESAGTGTRAGITHQPDDVAADAVTGIIPIVDDSEVGDDVHILDADDVEGADLAAPSGSFGAEHGPFDQADHEPAPTVAANVLDPDDEPEPHRDESHHDESHRDEAGHDDSAAGAAGTVAAAAGLGGLVAASRRARRDTDSTDEPAETVAANVLDDHADADHGNADHADADHGNAHPTDADPAERGPVADATADPETRDRASKARKARKVKPAKADGRESWADRKPVLAWLAVIAEVIAGLAIGVGLFWGFTELWKWNPYFALVLAVLVIFGIVTFTHLVRRTSDLITTLLALAVGLIVTIGPLVLLST
ncbi:DoxX family protein [Gordonia polyisoprenivorans]|uniref:DoxX family protein n=1 Tax=Gordonia polyisoprenivorans TaxID=84595 RepID=UPI0023014A0B|nr:DoxX family protein [Gordonia polyisoprenivorans]WCB38478.1 DoxX family protein [Gordonia polyisoprenivorans]